ncbi:MAG TPA: S8/S53 family peptidase, partial [Chloroflexota bacterium]
LAVSAVSGLDTARQYEEIRRSLNEALAVLLRSPAQDPRGSLERDLTPVALRRCVLERPEVLQPLDRLKESGQDLAPARSVGFGPRGAPTWALHCYQIGDSRDAPVLRTALVRELTLLANGRLRAASDRMDRSSLGHLLAVSPNWLTVGAPSGASEGSPAGRPAPAPKGDWRFTFRDPRLQELVDRATDSPVTVAVLDTSPSPRQVADAAARFTENRLLQRVVSPTVAVQLDGPLSVPPDYFAPHLGDIVPGWREAAPGILPDDSAFLMPDHGLFAAGTIRDLAPAAEIHLLRVLNDYGVGDLLAITHVMSRLPELFLTDQKRRLVVNLSLVADLPPSDRLLPFWLPNTAKDPATLVGRFADVCSILGAIHGCLSRTVDWLAQRSDQVLIVAAAGNDALGRPLRPEPRLPARYDDVLGVASVRRNGQASSFSNRGDAVVMGNGVAVLGGNAVPDPVSPSTRSPVVDTSTSPADAVTGIFSAERLPIDGQANETGWVYWAGTSFAAPIASAFAADVWATEPGLAAADVIARVRGFQSAPNADLEVPAIVATQAP